MLNPIDRCMRISPADKARLRLLFLAKHACKGGGADSVDGNHAVYHHEMRSTLEAIGLHVAVADSYDALFDKPDVDFVVTLLNRGGFQNSEMLAPLLLSWRGVPFLGASPIVRGVSDDKYLSKLIARAHGVPTMPARILRRGAMPAGPEFQAERLVVKPNASSASWGWRWSTAGRRLMPMPIISMAWAMTCWSRPGHPCSMWPCRSSAAAVASPGFSRRCYMCRPIRIASAAMRKSAA